MATTGKFRMYMVIKLIHVTTVILTFGMFLVRGIWMIAGSPLLQHRAVKILPHVNDTLLLLSAISMCVIIHQYPFVHAWLTAKVLALVVYIGLGTIALRPGRTKAIRIAAWVAALLTFAYIASVARTHSPLTFTV